MCDFGSLHVDREQTYVVYPPKIGEGICDGTHCSSWYCDRAHNAAAMICLECGQPIGYGGLLPLTGASWVCSDGTVVYSGKCSPLMIHADCFDRVNAARLQEAQDRQAATAEL